jgi:transcriptional regulator with GAF, ATPase, and Fis domain
MSSHAGESSLSLAERYERLKVIVDISKRLSSNLDLQSLLRDIASTVRRTLDTDAVAVSVLNAEETHLQIYAVDFPDSRFTHEGRLIPVEGTLIGNILKKGVSEVSDFSDLSSLKLPEGDAALIHAEGIRFATLGRCMCTTASLVFSRWYAKRIVHSLRTMWRWRTWSPNRLRSR